jgi:S1-C subfamily serine protease
MATESGSPFDDLPPLSPTTWADRPTPASTESLPPPPPASPAHGRSGLKAGLVGGIVGALVAGGVAFGTVRLTDDTTPAANAAPAALAAAPAPLTDQGFDVHGVLAKVGNAVVSIVIGQSGGGGIYNTAAGSGFIVSKDGFVVTNRHVVNDADTITVKFADGKSEQGRVVGVSSDHDVAVIKINDVHGATPLTLSDTKNLRVGDEVLAIGNALNLGDSPTVTLGIVSAKNRSIDTDTEHLAGLIQTDAAINPGNSGGPLVAADGSVVGINTAGVQGANSIGFAIDVNTVKDEIASLEQGKGSTGSPSPAGTAFLGVATADATDGVVVESVEPGTAAASAGLKAGDVLVKADGKDVTSSDGLRQIIRSKKPGDTLSLEVQRDGRTQTVKATLGQRQAS